VAAVRLTLGDVPAQNAIVITTTDYDAHNAPDPGGIVCDLQAAIASSDPRRTPPT
jgi:hypothetical protein